MNDAELKNEIIEQLLQYPDCLFCKKVGIFNKCKSSNCDKTLKTFFNEKIEIKK